MLDITVITSFHSSQAINQQLNSTIQGLIRQNTVRICMYEIAISDIIAKAKVSNFKCKAFIFQQVDSNGFSYHMQIIHPRYYVLISDNANKALTFHMLRKFHVVATKGLKRYSIGHRYLADIPGIRSIDIADICCQCQF